MNMDKHISRMFVLSFSEEIFNFLWSYRQSPCDNSTVWGTDRLTDGHPDNIAITVIKRCYSYLFITHSYLLFICYYYELACYDRDAVLFVRKSCTGGYRGRRAALWREPSTRSTFFHQQTGNFSSYFFLYICL